MNGFASFWDIMQDLEHKRNELNIIREWYKNRMEVAFKKFNLPRLANN